jgi:hypothetical protein
LETLIIEEERKFVFDPLVGFRHCRSSSERQNAKCRSLARESVVRFYQVKTALPDDVVKEFRFLGYVPTMEGKDYIDPRTFLLEYRTSEGRDSRSCSPVGLSTHRGVLEEYLISLDRIVRARSVERVGVINIILMAALIEQFAEW